MTEGETDTRFLVDYYGGESHKFALILEALEIGQEIIEKKILADGPTAETLVEADIYDAYRFTIATRPFLYHATVLYTNKKKFPPKGWKPNKRLGTKTKEDFIVIIRYVVKKDERYLFLSYKVCINPGV